MTVATTDGERVWAFRYSSERQLAVALLQHRRRRRCGPSIRRTSCSASVSDESRVVVSEPLGDARRRLERGARVELRRRPGRPRRAAPVRAARLAVGRSATRGRLRGDLWYLIGIAAVVLTANLPYLVGAADADPLGPRSGLASSVDGGAASGRAVGRSERRVHLAGARPSGRARRARSARAVVEPVRGHRRAARGGDAVGGAVPADAPAGALERTALRAHAARARRRALHLSSSCAGSRSPAGRAPRRESPSRSTGRSPGSPTRPSTRSRSCRCSCSGSSSPTRRRSRAGGAGSP